MPTKQEILEEPAGRRMDAWVAEYIFNTPIPESFKRHGILTDLWLLPCYSINIGDAWKVVKKLRIEHFKWFEMAHRPSGYICNFVGDPKYTIYAETAPLAICQAALLAVIENA